MHLLESSWVSAWADLDQRPVHEWAEERVILSPPISKTGPFTLADSRHLIEPIESCADPKTGYTNVLKPVRGAGSLIGDVVLAYRCENDPGPAFEIYQTDVEAGIYIRDRTLPILRNTRFSTPVLPANHVEGEGEIHLLNGYPLYMYGPSKTKLQSKPARWVRADECWLYEKGTLGEIEGRLGDYKNIGLSHMLCISQAGPKKGALDDCDWFHHYHDAEINEWEVQCLGCGKYFDPIFTGRRADDSYWGITYESFKLPNGDYDVARCLDSVHFTCPHCPYIHLDGARTKHEWNRTGRYRVPEKRRWNRRSFHYEAVIIYVWKDLLEHWLKSCNARNRGNFTPMLQFYQKYRAVFMDEETLLRTDRRFGRVVVTTGEPSAEWPEEHARFMTIDKQMDHYWVLICAWSKDGRVRRLYFGKAFGLAELEKLTADYKVLTHLTSRKGSNVFMDAAFEPAGVNGVFAACCQYGWNAVRGENPSSGRFLHHGKKPGITYARSYSKIERGDPGMGTRTQGARYCILIQFVKNVMNSRTQGLIEKERIEHASDLGKELEEEYRAQMASRIQKREYDPKRGTTKVWWWEGKNDHARDCWNMQVLAATLSDCLPDTLDDSSAAQ